MALRGYLRPRRPLPDPKPIKYSAAQQRDRRRSHLPVVLDGSFALSDEVLAVCSPVAARLAEEPNAGGQFAQRSVGQIGRAVVELTELAADLIATDRAKAAVGPEAQAKAKHALRDVTRRPAPEISLDALRSGSWAAALSDYARPVSAALGSVLGRAAADKSRFPQESTRVIAELRELDRLVLSLDREITRAQEWRASLPAPRPNHGPRDLSGAIAELERLGVRHDDLLTDNEGTTP